MEKSKWFLECTVHIWGEDSEGSGRDVTDTLCIQLAAKGEASARVEANFLAGTFIEAISRKDLHFFMQYCGEIDSGENLEFSQFILRAEKPLDLSIPRLNSST